MARIRVNLDDIPDAPESLDPGKYTVKLVEATDYDNDKGNPTMVWTWEVVGGDFDGRTIKSWTSLMDHALFGLKEVLAAFGLEGDLDFDTDKLLGKKVKITVGMRKGKSRDGEPREFASIIKLERIVTSKGAEAQKGKVAAKSGTRRSGNDIPF